MLEQETKILDAQSWSLRFHYRLHSPVSHTRQISPYTGNVYIESLFWNSHLLFDEINCLTGKWWKC